MLAKDVMKYWNQVKYYGDLMYHFKIKNVREKSFDDFDNAFRFFRKKKRNGNIMLKKSKKNQDEYKLNLNKRRKVRQN